MFPCAYLEAQRQRPETLHSLEGTVSDPSGAAIVGADVTLFDAQGKPIGHVTTDGAGHFRFTAVPAGAAKIATHDAGFQNNETALKGRGLLRITMSLASVKEEVSVSGETTAINTETAQNQNSNALDRSTLDRIPVFDQDYIATISQFLDQGALATGGVTLIVNGVEANGAGVTASAIQEIKINQNPFSALYSRPGRARIEITTKSGTPDYHGTLNFLFRDATFDASNRFASVKPPEQRQYYEGSVTGPISPDKKTTFLNSLDYDSDNQEAFVVADTPTGSVRANVPTPMRHLFASGRIFHSFSDTHTVWIGYSYEQRTTENQGVGGTVLPSAATTIAFQEHEINVGDTKVISPKWLNQLRFLVGHENAPITSNINAPQIVVLDSFVTGGAQADSKRTEAHFDGADIVTYTSGRNELKFGIDVPDISRRGADDFSNRLGTYTFASIADYQAGRPQTLLLLQGQGHLVFLEKNFAGFIEDTFRIRPNFTLTLGARYYWQNFFHDDANNLAPRFGFAWSPGKQRKTVVRGGGGIFYDRTGPRPIGDLLHFNGSSLRQYLIDNPAYDPACPGCNVGNAPTSVATLAPGAVIPYTVQWSLGVERQLTSRTSIGANWVSSRGIHLFRSLDVNAPPPPDYAARPDALLGQHRQIQSEGRQVSDALELSFKGSISRFFTGQALYTLSKTYNNTSGITWFPENSYSPDTEWARADTDQRHRLNFLGTTKVRNLFELGTVLAVASGKPYSIITGFDDNNDGLIIDRPAGLPRNTGHGPGLLQLDLSATHEFKLGAKKEGPALSVGLAAFNILNHPNYVSYVGTLTSRFFGHPVAALPARRVQANVEFKF